jgi:hypothetical protein
MHSNTPRLSDAQSGSLAPQSAQWSFPGAARSSLSVARVSIGAADDGGYRPRAPLGPSSTSVIASSSPLKSEESALPPEGRTKRSRGGVERRQVELKGVEGGD